MANQNNKLSVREKADPTVEFVTYLQKIKGLSERTIYHYLTYHRHFMDQQLTQKNITKFIASKNNNSVCRGYMNAWLEFLKKDKEFDLPKVKTGSGKKRLVRNVSKHEMQKIIECAYKGKLRHGLMIDLIYWGALRRAEVCTIKINSINWDAWFIDPDDFCEVNVIGKRNKERTVVMHPKTVRKILDIYLKKGIITPHMEINDIVEKLSAIDRPILKKMAERYIYEIVRKYAEKGIKRTVRPHEIRHARATHLEEDGATVRQIQRYLGHSNMATTEIYLHSSAHEGLKAIKKLSKPL